MATLTENAYYARQGVKFAFFAFLALIILKIALNALGSVWKGFYRPPPPKPDVAFGKLSQINFPTNREPSEPVTYTAEFVGGSFPESSSSARVYFTPKPAPNFLSLGRANDFARSLGFEDDPLSLTPALYQWTDRNYPLRTLQKDIFTGNFTLRFDFYKDLPVLKEGSLPYGKAAISEATGFLQGYGLLSPDLIEGKTTVSFWKSTGSGLVSVSSVSEAEITRVDIFRASLDGLARVGPSFREAPAYFLFGGSPESQKRILTLRYIFRPLEKEIFATYPLKTTKEAWRELEQGKGYIADWGTVKGTHVTIRRASLAYYDSEDYQPYLQPVFVFESDEGFAAYAPAILKDYLE